ncbi:MAG: hypothetical protein M1831_003970 [Alyxoria varia]|nr:MAG: hypothetical protein M1831_003970 [Alyxoria varia]
MVPHTTSIECTWQINQTYADHVMGRKRIIRGEPFFSAHSSRPPFTVQAFEGRYRHGVHDFLKLVPIVMLPRLSVIRLREDSHEEQHLYDTLACGPVSDRCEWWNALPFETVELVGISIQEFVMEVTLDHVNDLIRLTRLSSVETLRGFAFSGTWGVNPPPYERISPVGSQYPGRVKCVELTRVDLQPELFGPVFAAMEDLRTLKIAYHTFDEIYGIGDSDYDDDSFYDRLSHEASAMIGFLSKSRRVTETLEDLSITLSDQDDISVGWFPYPIESILAFTSLRKLELDAAFLAPALFRATHGWKYERQDYKTVRAKEYKTRRLLEVLPESIETVRLAARLMRLPKCGGKVTLRCFSDVCGMLGHLSRNQS